MREPIPLPIVLRGFPEPPPSKRARPPAPPLRDVLILDVETTIDTRQRLLFGGYQMCRMQRNGTLAVREHGLFFDEGVDGLSADAARFAREWTADRIVANAGRRLRFRLLSRAAFVHDVLLKAAGKLGALIVGFNLPFDLARLSDGFTVARGGAMADGFSLILPPHPTSRKQWKPRIRLKLLGERRALFAISSKGLSNGRFLDLRTLLSALTGESYSLDVAADHYGIPHRKPEGVEHGQVTRAYLDYHANDLDMTRLVCARACGELATHPIDLAPDRALSAAALGRGYLAAMHVRPALGRSIPASHRMHGIAMEAYGGAWAGVQVRGVPVPVIPVDFRSQYPTVNVLLGLWPLMTADRLAVDDCTADTRRLLAEVSRDWLFDRANWSALQFFAKIRPDGDILPVRAEYPGTRVPGMGINMVTSDEAQWVAGPDLAASVLRTGRLPDILDAVRLRVEAPGCDLQTVHFQGRVSLDPHDPDFFARLVEERERLKRDGDPNGIATGLKLFTNALAYGISVQFTPVTPKASDPPGHVWLGDQRHALPAAAEEVPGPYCFPAVGALTTAGGRLLLAMLEHEVTRRGGTFAACDTDGMTIVAVAERMHVAAGGPTVLALGADDVREIVNAFRTLSPFSEGLANASILKIEYPDLMGEVQALCVSAKRYALFRLDAAGGLHIVKASEHGLGHLVAPIPRDEWCDEVWHYGIAKALGRDPAMPAWWHAPALMRLTATRPSVAPAQAFAQAHLLPLSFVLTPVLDGLAGPWHPSDPIRLVHPYVVPAPPLSRMRWLDLHTGTSCIGGTDVEAGPGVVPIKALGQVVQEHLHKPETKSCDAAGARCTRATVGPLIRMHVRPSSRRYTGKEVSGRALSVEAPDGGAPVAYTSAAMDDAWRAHLAALPSLKAFAAFSGMLLRTLQRAKNGRGEPAPETLRKIRAGLRAFGER